MSEEGVEGFGEIECGELSIGSNTLDVGSAVRPKSIFCFKATGVLAPY